MKKNKMNNFSKYEKIYNYYIHVISNSIEDILEVNCQFIQTCFCLMKQFFLKKNNYFKKEKY